MKRTLVTASSSLAMAVLVVGCTLSAQGGTDTSPREIDLSVDGYQFVPDHVEVTQGETVRFVVTNATDVAHEIYIGTPAEQEADEMAHQSAAPMDQAKLSTKMGYGEYLPAYSRVDFTYHFSGSTEVMIGCHLPGHWARGMKASIDVRHS